MGGHGGLNILPQKKWNVYNMENRNIVERDKRQERERVEREQLKEHKEQARDRIQQLKKKRRNVSQTPSRSGSRSRSRDSSQSKQKPEQSNINAELKKIQEDKKHINLFEEEEQQLLQKQNTQARIELEKEFFKDKPFDLSTKFLGAYDQDKPWYVKQRPDDQQQTYQHTYVRDQLKQFKESKDQYYKVLDLSKKYQQNTLISQIEVKKEEEAKQKKEENERLINSKEEQKKQKRLQKLAIKLKDLLGSDDSESEKKRQKQRQYERDKLRKERLQRERVERSREQKLLAIKYEFKQNDQRA